MAGYVVLHVCPRGRLECRTRVMYLSSTSLFSNLATILSGRSQLGKSLFWKVYVSDQEDFIVI